MNRKFLSFCARHPYIYPLLEWRYIFYLPLKFFEMAKSTNASRDINGVGVCISDGFSVYLPYRLKQLLFSFSLVFSGANEGKKVPKRRKNALLLKRIHIKRKRICNRLHFLFLCVHCFTINFFSSLFCCCLFFTFLCTPIGFTKKF